MKRMLRIVAGAAVAMALALAAAPPASARPDIALSADQIGIVQQINAYLTGLRSLKGRFTQRGPAGQFTEGDFYLQRPGRMRFEYAPPNPILVIADGFWVGIEDRKLRSTQKYPLAATPLSLLLGERVDLLEKARIIGYEEKDGEISVTLEAKAGTTPGQLTLIFGLPNINLKRWTVVDAQGLSTEVNFFDMVTGLSLNPKLFWIDDHLLLDMNER